MRYFIDLSEINNIEQLHDALESALPLPDYYGRNLDALHDALTSMAVYYPSCEIIVNGSDNAIQGDAGSYIRKLRRMCDQLEEEEDNLFFFWI